MIGSIPILAERDFRAQFASESWDSSHRRSPKHTASHAGSVYVAEIDLDAAEAAAPKEEGRVEPLPRYPSVTRDISVLIDDTLAAATIRATVRDAAPASLAQVREFDRYQGKGVPEERSASRCGSPSGHLTEHSPMLKCRARWMPSSPR